MDSRIEPLAMLGLGPGDAKILRNAGGRVTTDVLRSLILATRFLGVRRIAVMQHTGCALAGRTDDDIQIRPGGRRVSSAGGVGLSWPCPIPTPPSEPTSTPSAACRLLPAGVGVEGWRYDVDTGEIVQVVGSSRSGLGPSAARMGGDGRGR